MTRFRFVAVLLIAELASPAWMVPVARADEAAELTAARAKFQRAIELKQAGDFAGALSLFREVGQFKMTPQVRYHIAGCEEGLGKLVAAYGGYELARAQGQDMPPDFLAEVDAALERLGERIPKLVITRGKGAAAAKIELDGVSLGAASIGRDVPVDPGPHAITATAPGYQDYSGTIEATESSTVTVVVDMVRLPTVEPPKYEPPPEEPPKGYGITPYVVGGVGLGLATVGVILLPVSQASIGDANDICPNQDCTGKSAADQSRVRDILSGAQTTEAVGWSLIGVGVAAVAVGTTLYFVDPARKKQPDVAFERGPFSLIPSAPRTEAGLSLRATF